MTITKQTLQSVTQTELAALLDVSMQTLATWKRNSYEFGNFPAGEKQGNSNTILFNYYACKLWHEKYLLTTKYKDYFNSSPKDNDENEDWKKRKERASALFEELELSKAQNKLMDKKEVDAIWSDIVLNIRSKLLVTPRRIANLLHDGMTTVDRETAIEKEIRDILDYLSSQEESEELDGK